MNKDLVEDYKTLTNPMKKVQEKARLKAFKKVDYEKHVLEPWKKHNIVFLDSQLHEEFKEFKYALTKKQKQNELLDIINMATFLYLRLDRETNRKKMKDSTPEKTYQTTLQTIQAEIR